ncbi:unnamed protein product [Cochlearia groenlandica]
MMRKSVSLSMQFLLDVEKFQVKHKWRFKLLRPVSDSADVVTTQEAEKWRFKYLGVLLKPHGDDREFLAFITENVMAPLVFSSLWASLLSWGKVTMICGRDSHDMWQRLSCYVDV